MESEEITKLVDGIYKNILEKFNPGTRQMINAGKAYLKALHGAAAASRVYVDAITKLARQAQQATWSGCTDIGSALMQIVEVYKETQAQQMNILKAFYVDVLVPLETNLEKDTKVVQSEQKRFLQQHKQHIDSYTKAATTVKKYRKKQGRNSKNMDKELKSMQILEEEKNKLDDFCEQSLKHAMTQERRRYGFVLERQSSLAKHNMAFYEKQQALVAKYLDNWSEIAKSREQIPETVENMFTTNLTQINFYPEEQPEGGDSPEEDIVSLNSQLRKTKSVESTCLESTTNGQEITADIKQHPLLKAKSDYNVNDSTLSLHRADETGTGTLQKAKTPANGDMWVNKYLVRALYSYLSNGENQLSFLKGDLISVIGERNKGWQYGENLRTKFSGWFPTAYTEPIADDETISSSPRRYRKNSFSVKSTEIYASSPNVDNDEPEKIGPKYLSNKQPTHKFGDSIVKRHQNQGRRVQENPFSSIPPPVMPAPIAPMTNNDTVQRDPRGSPAQAINGKKAQNGNASLHSSNDSGFSNDPPPAPDVDYSDDELNSRSHTLVKKSPDKTLTAKASLNGKKKEYNSSVSEWLNGDANGAEYSSSTLYNKRRHPPIRQSSSVGHLVTLGRLSSGNNAHAEKEAAVFDKKIKRTKSLWKFKKADDVLEGMSLWKHRSLVDINSSSSGGADVHFNRGTPVLDKRMTVTREISVDSGDENSTLMNGVSGGGGGASVAGIGGLIGGGGGGGGGGTQGKASAKSSKILYESNGNNNNNNNNNNVSGSSRRRVADSDDDDDVDDSDQESCIVVDDHRKTDSVKSKLPRTHLAGKTNSSSSVKVENGFKEYKDNESDMIFESSKLQTFKYNRVADQSWYDSWGERRKK